MATSKPPDIPKDEIEEPITINIGNLCKGAIIDAFEKELQKCLDRPAMTNNKPKCLDHGEHNFCENCMPPNWPASALPDVVEGGSRYKRVPSGPVCAKSGLWPYPCHGRLELMKEGRMKGSFLCEEHAFQAAVAGEQRGETPHIIKNRSTAKGQEFWDHIESVASQVRQEAQPLPARPETYHDKTYHDNIVERIKPGEDAQAVRYIKALEAELSRLTSQNAQFIHTIADLSGKIAKLSYEALASKEEQGGWIDCKQELPQHGAMVIGSRNGRAFIYRYNSAANPEFPFRDEFGSGDGPSVTHWQPLPTPPDSRKEP